jgi:hypothetical protein
MKLLLFPASVATAIYAMQNWEWAFYLALWAFLTGMFYMLFYAIYRCLFEP